MTDVGTDLAMRLWCAIVRCHCSLVRIVDIDAGGYVPTRCMSCTDDLAVLTGLGYVNAAGSWVS